MKHNWHKQYPLQQPLPGADVSAAVREHIRKKMQEDTQKGTILMNSKKKRRTAILCAAAASFLLASAIGIHAAASSGLWQTIQLWINGEELTASVSQEGDKFYCEIEGGSSSDIIETETTFYAFEDPNTEFYAECDTENRLWLKATTDDTFAIDVTDELTRNGSYTVTCICGESFTQTITIEGTSDDFTLTITPIESDMIQSVDIPLQ
ncbi:MAG: hypothetical protein ACI4JQ_04725 [Ruminococcus sp.]